MDKTILVIGTFDTKTEELAFISSVIEAQGGHVLTMDVSVLGTTTFYPYISKHDVAAAADITIEKIIEKNDENAAMQAMAQGASALCAQYYEDKKFDGILALGGTMGTDLALDCANSLPIGVPKYIVSTVAFSPLIPADRLPADVQMILWAGGLYGLNAICKSALSQAAGAVLGAARAVEPMGGKRPIVGITSLGKSCLKYMVTLKPELEARGYEVAIFHSTGMGGRAFESISSKGGFACVMDFCLQEFVNGLYGSVVNSGAGRLQNSGANSVPQIVAPGACDIVDFATWQGPPKALEGRPYHVHNRLIASAAISPNERRDVAKKMLEILSAAKGPTHLLLPAGGIEEWDRPGGDAHDPEGLAAFVNEIDSNIPKEIGYTKIDGHINDEEFCKTALNIFDDWVAKGLVVSPE